MLISRTGSPEDAPSLRPLLEHEDQNVRTHIVEALLKFKDPWAVIGLRKAIGSKDRGVSSRAFFMAGSYQVADVAQDLVSMIKRMVLFKSDYGVNEEIIRALGQIGDPCAIPVLEKLARTTRTFYPKSLSHMKVVLFRSLAGYPNEYLTALLNTGKESSDERIQRTCRELMERK
jgi:hypothetical protein